MFEKVLGKDIRDAEQRRKFLLDNCDEVKEIDYFKAFDAEELQGLEHEVAGKFIRMAQLKQEVKDFKEHIDEELKPLTEESKRLLDDLKQKGRMVNEKCYKFLDEGTHMVGFYNAAGELVYQRTATRDERQKTIFAELRREGTNN